MVKAIDPKDSKFTYEYTNDGKRNLIKATSAENVIYSFTYDSFGNPLTSKVGSGTLYIDSKACYSASGNYINTITDSLGNTVDYNYNESKGTLSSMVDAKGTTTTNSYDSNLDRLASTSKTVDGVNVTNSYAYENDRIDSITHNGFSYNFGYDSLGNNTTVSVGNQNLITNSYEVRTGKLLESTYGNGQKIGNDYDSLDRITAKKYNGTVVNRYNYDASGSLGFEEDILNGVSYRYIYDTAGRLVKVNDSKENSTSYNYDLNNNISKIIDKVNGNSYETTYSYNKDNREALAAYNRNSEAGKLYNSLIAYYNFDNSDATDSSGNNYTGSLKGSPQFVNSAGGKALKLDGVDDWVELPDFKVPETFSVSLWVNPYVIKDQCYLGKHTDTGDNIFLFGMWDAGNEIRVRTDTNPQGAKTTGYQHVVAVVKKISSTQSNVKFYKNNTLLWEKTFNSVLGDTKGKGWSIGQDWDGRSATDFLNGEIDDIGVFNYDLSQTDINTLYTQKDALNKLSLSYDSIGRITKKSIFSGTTQYDTAYTYQSGVNGASSNSIKTISNNGNSISYTYDKNGNIETITQGSKVIKYYYNELNEVIREDNGILNKTITYSYDAGGNTRSKVEYAYTTGTLGAATDTISYTYSDTNWKDKLTSYDGKAITYDEIGNPLTYDGYTYTWEQGRQLKTITGNNNTISFKYNDAGIRTEKTVNGAVTKYHLVGDKVTYEDNGTDKIYYTYDSLDNLVSMNLNGVEYYYIRNAQGDIIGLFDKSGAQVVSYTYDSWGKLVSIAGTLSSTVGAKNPYRYRGYRYDSETGLYYLQSRYYNPDWGRFINADGIIGQTGELLGHNLFAYCKNNPVPRLKHS